jgi:hypothetical protein
MPENSKVFVAASHVTAAISKVEQQYDLLYTKNQELEKELQDIKTKYSNLLNDFSNLQFQSSMFSQDFRKFFHNEKDWKQVLNIREFMRYYSLFTFSNFDVSF